MRLMPILLLSVLSACVMVDSEQVRPDPTVKPALSGRDCVYMIVLPVMVGTVTADQAMHNGALIERVMEPGLGHVERATPQPITKVHSIRFEEFAVPFYGRKCVVVTGE